MAKPGICDTARLLSSAASVNPTVVKAAAGKLHAIHGYNAHSAVIYLKIYDKPTAPDETDVPKLTIALPAEQAFALAPWGERGYWFGTGISFRLVAAAADNSTSAVGSGHILGLNLDFS